MKRISVILVAMLCSVSMLSAQKLNGSIKFLKGQSNINVVFDYTQLNVGDKPEADFVKERLASEKDEAGAADWQARWEKAREEFKTKFYEACTGSLKKAKIEVGVYPEAEYTIIVKVSNIDQGRFFPTGGMLEKSPFLTGEVAFVKTGTTEELASVIFKKVSAGTASVQAVESFRLEHPFSELGRQVGRIINKNT
jgi:hypothetical protein